MRRLFRKTAEFNWKYVIGELLLIVSGILIALYISDLNEAKKTRVFEKQILTEIEKSLDRDLEWHIKNRVARAERIIQSTEVILRLLDQEIAYHDSLENHFWALSKVILFEPQTIPFERLKSKGIESLSDEKVRV